VAAEHRAELLGAARAAIHARLRQADRAAGRAVARTRRAGIEPLVARALQGLGLWLRCGSDDGRRLLRELERSERLSTKSHSDDAIPATVVTARSLVARVMPRSSRGPAEVVGEVLQS
jgi:hypothetical protein